MYISKVLKRLEGYRRNFLWGSKDVVKIPWVAWDKVLNSKEKGGLAIGSLKAQNLVPLAKWWWRFKLEDNCLWKQVIIAFHGSDCNFNSVRSGPGVWFKIIGIKKQLEKSNIHIGSLFAKSLGNGRNTRFWTEDWSGNGPLESLYPRLARLDVDRNCTVNERVMAIDDGPNFIGRWRRRLIEGRENKELREIQNFCDRIHLGERTDRWKWALDTTGNYTVSSLRRAIDDKDLRRCGPSTTWNKVVPSKVRFFFWKARINGLPTKVNLVARGVSLTDDRCVFCKSHPETCDHLFVSCEKSKAVRDSITTWWDCFADNSNTIEDLCAQRSIASCS